MVMLMASAAVLTDLSAPGSRTEMMVPPMRSWLPGIVGVLQAVEVVKYILGKGDLLTGRLLVYDALAASMRELKVRANPKCKYCADGVEFPGYIDYQGFCGV